MRTILINQLSILRLVSLASVRPSPWVNDVFARFVHRVVQVPFLHNTLFARFFSKRIRSICAQGEFALELYWAKRILQSKNSAKELERFPYYKNYDCLTRREWGLVKAHFGSAKKVVFLGSGPLPLTVIILAKLTNCQITLVDKDQRACSISSQLIKQLGLTNIEVLCADAKNCDAVADADLVYVAALVGGNTEEEKMVYEQLAKHVKEDVCLLVRSAHTSRKLLYHPVSKTIDAYFQRFGEVHFHDDIINSAILLTPYA